MEFSVRMRLTYMYVETTSVNVTADFSYLVNARWSFCVVVKYGSM